MADESLSQEQRFPLLSDVGRNVLRRLQQHPHGPRFNYPCGERLDARGLQKVRSYASELATHRTGWRIGEIPPWLDRFVRRCREEVSFYRQQPDWSEDFFSLPMLDRTAIRREPWSFVPDSADLDELIVYRTSGTSGNLMQIISHPVAPNRYLPLMQRALAAYGISIEGGNRVSIIQVAAQKQTYTLASVMSYFNSAGFAKVNLNPAEWRHPDDRVRFLDDCAPELYTGDPFAFAELASLPLISRPKALISSATSLSPTERTRLEGRFGCPVIDVYALNEAGPVAYSHDDGHDVLPHDLYVEVVTPDGRPAPAGQIGEIVVTGGVNPNLPLLRYRTGDFAALDFSSDIPRLVNFAGRKPVHFRGTAGQVINSIEVTVALFDIPLPFFSLYQDRNAALTFTTRCDATVEEQAQRSLYELFGHGQRITIVQVPIGEAWQGKWIQYKSDLIGAT